MKKIIVTLVILNFHFFAFAQSIFKAGAGIGVNFSQVDGDLQQGFDRSSWTFGLRGAVILNKNSDISVELQYNEKGASTIRQDRVRGQYIELDFRYAEVPILFNYHFEQRPNGTFKWTYSLGASYGRLLEFHYYAVERYQIDQINTIYMQPERFKSNEFSVVSGFSYNPMPRLSLNFRLSLAVNRIYEIPAEILATIPANRQRVVYSGFQNYFVSTTLSYDFIAPKPTKKRTKKTKITSFNAPPQYWAAQ